MKAIIVEDEMVVARDLSNLLGEIGYTVSAIAKRANKAVELIEQHRPDIALIDIVLRGDEDGIALAHILRANYALPFLFITAHADRATVERAKAAQPDGYLVKPFSKDDLYAATELALSSYAGERTGVPSEAEKNRRRELPPLQLRKVKTYVKDHLNEDLTVAQLAEVANLSQHYFSRLFKASVGVAPYRYVVQQRIERACHLLERTETPITGIASRTGFSSQSHFSTAFKQHTGSSPSRYRASMQT